MFVIPYTGVLCADEVRLGLRGRSDGCSPHAG